MCGCTFIALTHDVFNLSKFYKYLERKLNFHSIINLLLRYKPLVEPLFIKKFVNLTYEKGNE